MNLLFLLIVGCFLWGCRVRLTGFAEDYLSPYNSRCFRGILAVVVMCYHLSQRTGDRSLFHLFVYFGFLMVAYFLFQSGYGLQKSYGAKPDYRARILKNRIPAVLIPFGILLVVYWALRWFEGSHMHPVEALLSVFSRKQVVSYSWYIRAMVLFYLMFYLSTWFLKGNHILIPMLNLLMVLCYTAVVKKLGFDHYWYNTCVAFPLGILWAEVEEKWLPALRRNYFVFLPVAAAGFGVQLVSILRYPSQPWLVLLLYWGCSIAFVMLMLLVQMKVTFHNKLLAWIGGLSLEIYMIHGFFIILYRGNHFYISDPAIWSAAVLLSSLICGWAFHRLLQKCRK